MLRHVCAGAATLFALAGGVAAADITAEQRAELAQYFGFAPPQIYKLRAGIGNLRVADLNGDNRNDVCVWNNYDNYFEFFLQPAADAKAAPPAEKPAETNEISDRGPLRRERVALPYSVDVEDYEIADVTGDQINDLVIFGEPRELMVMPGVGDGKFGAPATYRAADGAARAGTLVVGDFNHDQRTDVALLGDQYLLIFKQDGDGRLQSPQRLLHDVKNPLALMAADIDGNGRTDLLLAADDDQYGAYVILQDANGALGAMRRLRVPKLRSLTPASTPRGADLLAIQYATGRLLHYRWGPPPEGAAQTEWPQQIYTMPSSSREKRQPLVIGDLTNDGRTDVVSAGAETAELFLLAGQGDGLAAAHAFPGLMKTQTLQIVDLDADGQNELLVFSPEEKTVGVVRYDGERLTFPQPLELAGRPLAVTVGDGRVAYITRDDDRQIELCLAATTAPADVTTRVKVEDLKDDVAGLRFFDADQDGRADLLAFVRFGALLTFLQGEDGGFTQLRGAATRESLVKNASWEGYDFADIDADGKPELLLPQGPFARALRVVDGKWQVIEQFNPPQGNAEISGVAAIPGANGHGHVVLYDRKSRDLIALRRAERGWLPDAQTAIGALELITLAALPLGDAQSPRWTVAAADVNKLIVLSPDGAAPQWIEQSTYDSDEKDAFLADAIVGDVNHDGIRDVILRDTRKASLEILTTLPDGDYARALRFQVFQGKRFSGDPDSAGEPSDAVLGDVTGDGVDDVLLLAHDRLLIYPGMGKVDGG